MRFLNFLWNKAVDMWERGDCIRLVVFIIGLFFAFGLLIMLFWLGMKFVLIHLEEILVIVGVPVGLVLWIRYALLERGKDSDSDSDPKPQPEAVELVRARADNTYPLMEQTAFLLFTELCRYLPGLIRPFSLKAVEAPTHYSIMRDYVTIFHFVLPKGTEDTPPATVKEILDSIISQHLRSNDLPIAVPATYTTQQGEVYQGLVCDGIYDVGQFFKIDLVITNEAEATRLKARQISGMTGVTVLEDVKDKDFDK